MMVGGKANFIYHEIFYNHDVSLPSYVEMWKVIFLISHLFTTFLRSPWSAHFLISPLFAPIYMCKCYACVTFMHIHISFPYLWITSKNEV